VLKRESTSDTVTHGTDVPKPGPHNMSFSIVIFIKLYTDTCVTL